MTLKQSLFLIVLSLLFLAGLVQLVRQRHIREQYSLLWIGMSVLLFSVPFLLDEYVAIGSWFGIVNPISILTFFAILTLFLLALQFTLSLTRSHRQRNEIAQQVALLEARVADLEQLLAKSDSCSGENGHER
ncbi:MAG: DUF2304 domain-containing protein [Magnetococcales bacterium]|nr:DUF2304 domain-containing protein [Magnetococcales bacterium]